MKISTFIPQSIRGKIRLSLLLLLLVYIVSKLWYVTYSPKEGDIVFQSLPSADLVDAIEGVTNSPYSHCGMVIKKDGEWFVREALGVVHDTPLNRWIIRGDDFRVDAFRLKDEYQKYVPLFIQKSKDYLKRPYDSQYRMDDESIYCSELVYKAFRDATDKGMGELQKLGDLNWKPYKDVIAKYARMDEVPLDRIMITPRSVAESTMLEQVH